MSPRLAAALALTLVPLTVVLAFVWAPINEIGLVGGEMQYDFAQKIFYIHVPIAFAAYLCFFAGAWNGVLYLLRGRDDYDVRSYCGVHSGMVVGTLVLLTGSIWAKAAWGVWWNWDDRQLLVFLTLFLFYGAYYVLRFSIDPGRARNRASAIYAVLGVTLVPLSFMAIRIADTVIHPIVLTSDGGRLTGPMWGTFAIGVVGFAALAIWMLQLEATGKLRAMRGWGADEERPAAAVEAGDGSRSDAAPIAEAAAHA